MKHSRGFAWLPVLIALVAVLGVSGGAYFYTHPQKAPSFDFSLAPMASSTVAKTDSSAAQTTSVSEIGIKKYEGAWFDILYPANFNVQKIGADEAAFTAPDNSVQFYVYSPQWSGNPSSYLEPLPNEVIESDESKTDINPAAVYPEKVTRYVTFAAKDSSYKRSFVSIKTEVLDEPQKGGQDAVFHLVFGIKYTNQAAYTKYLNDYLAFKKSLVQYAD